MRPTRHDLEDIWRERVKEAQLRYEQSSVQFRRVWSEYFDVRLNADGAHAISKAREAESRALADYARVLKIFSELVAAGKLPPEGT